MPTDPPPAGVAETDRLVLIAGPWDAAGRCRTPSEGREVRVQGAIPGERVAVNITGTSRGAPVAWGDVVEVLDPAPEGPARREPPCPLHGACGACGLQHADEAGRLDARVRSALPVLPPRLAAALADRAEWIEAPRPFGYRHKAILLPSLDGDRLLLGGFARGTHDVVDLADCRVLAPGLAAADAALRTALGPLIVGGSLAATPRGTAPVGRPGLRAVILRGSRDGAALATFVATGRKPTKILRPTAARLVKIGAIAGAFIQEHDGRGDAVAGRRRPKLLAGARTAVETVAGAPFTLGPLAFFQVNPDVLEAIAERVARACAGATAILDLYCGGGVLGVVAARAVGAPLTGVDVAPASIESAQRDAAAAGVEARFHAGTPADVLDAHGPRGATVVLDPPRGGCRPDDLAAALAKEPRRVVYVGCSTASLARDARVLKAAGYAPVELLPADMLPQTPHLEWVAIWDAP